MDQPLFSSNQVACMLYIRIYNESETYPDTALYTINFSSQIFRSNVFSRLQFDLHKNMHNCLYIIIIKKSDVTYALGASSRYSLHRFLATEAVRVCVCVCVVGVYTAKQACACVVYLQERRKRKRHVIQLQYSRTV